MLYHLQTLVHDGREWRITHYINLGIVFLLGMSGGASASRAIVNKK